MDLVMQHIKFKHKFMLNSAITCKFDNCNDKFTNVYSLRRHVLNKHYISETKSASSISSKRTNDAIIDASGFSDVTSAIPNFDPNNSNENPKKIDNTIETNDFIKNEKFNIDDYHSIVFKSALSAIVKIYADLTLNRKAIYKIIKIVSETYLTTCIQALQQYCENNSDLNISLNMIKNGFAFLKSEETIFKYLEKINCLFLPKRKIVRTYLTFGKVRKVSQNKIYHSMLSFVYLKPVLKRFLELPNVLDAIDSFAVKCQINKNLRSVFQGQFWKSVVNETSEYTLPLAIYFDDFEINNPLGSRKCKNKLGAVYCSILCLPPEFASKLENIFLIQLHKYEDHKLLNNKKLFINVVREIQELVSNGIAINKNGREKKIFFKLCYIVGDNLGLNTILGFIKNFNQSYCCRICVATKEQIQSMTIENSEILRRVDNYSKHASKQSFGIIEKCIFNDIPGYHVISNASVDPMHDILEGICRYDMALILSNLIGKHKFFTIEILNERICTTSSSCHKNITPVLKHEAIKNKKIILTASEMHYLVDNLVIFVGDLVPVENPTWKLYLMMRQITNISLFDIISDEIIDFFSSIVSQYLKLYLELFENKLRLKHHNLLHYGQLMRKFGPLKYMSSIRFEGKHKMFKNNSKVVTSRKNPPYTFAVRHQLYLCNRFINEEGFSLQVIKGATQSKLILVDDFDNFKQILPSKLFYDYDSVSWVRINGTLYAINDIINRSNTFNFSFATIKCILISPLKEVYFLCQTYSNVCYCNHLQSFEVKQSENWVIIQQNMLVDYKVYKKHFLSNARNYIPCMFLF